MKITFIGDVHGKWGPYRKIIRGTTHSLQVGDFGVGFISHRTEEPCSNPPHSHMAKGQHFFIRGNHDNPEACRKHPFWIPDGGNAFGRQDIFCVGGAMSIDKHLRTQGYDWWPDEELAYSQLCTIMGQYEATKPSIVVSHECPESVISRVCHSRGIGKYDIPSVTRRCFDNMLEIHKPDLWVHGHWHIDHHTVHSGVEFIGLGELVALGLDI